MQKDNVQEKKMEENAMQKNNMQENEKKGSLARELKEKLDWYILEASEEEYDEKAVEYILYLLDGLEPLQGDKMPQTEEAWQRFQTLAEQRRRQASGGKPANVHRSYGSGIDKGVDKGRRREPAAATQNTGRVVSFALHHKIIAAAILSLLVLALGSTAQTMARKDAGFFHWLKQDDTGKQMMTSPESLDEKTEMTKHIYYNGEDVPEWAQEWIQIVNQFEFLEKYEWRRFETYTMNNQQTVSSHYINRGTENELTFGMELYFRKVSYDSGRFDDYIYVEGYEKDGKWREIYKKIEDSGKICHIIYFTEDNGQYFIIGQDDLEELKSLTELYWERIKNDS